MKGELRKAILKLVSDGLDAPVYTERYKAATIIEASPLYKRLRKQDWDETWKKLDKACNALPEWMKAIYGLSEKKNG